MSKLVQFPGPNCIVETLQGNAPHIAWVLEESSGKLRLWTIANREMKLPANRLLPWSGPNNPVPASRREVELALIKHEQARRELAKKVDPLELWELCQGETPKATAAWLAGLVFTDPGADEIAAVGRALLENKTHFRFQPPDFEIFPAEVVEKRVKEREAARVRELVIEQGRDFLKELWNQRTAPEGQRKKLPALDPDAAEALKKALMEQIAFSGEDDGAAKGQPDVWSQVRKGLPDHPYLPLLLAEAWGIVPRHFNYLAERARYALDDRWAAAFAPEIAGHVARCAELLREPEGAPFVTIDDSSTRDIDDGFHAEKTATGVKLSIALARPSLTWEFGSPLDMAVRDRATSVYLPEGAAHMMPEALSTDLYSLKAGEVRPALVVDLELDEALDVVSATPRLAVIRVVENIPYEVAEERLERGQSESLTLALAIARKQRDRRVQRGACVTERQDAEIVLTGPGGQPWEYGGSVDPEVDARLVPSNPNAQLLVSELMILANSLIPAWARERGAALYYRTQDTDLPPQAAGVWTRPEQVHAAMRKMTPTSLETQPSRHAGLGLTGYAPLSSPLRRYPDLVNVAQVQALLETGAPRFSREEMNAMLPDLTGSLDAAGQIQRQRPRYWKLEYLRRQKRNPVEAVLVEDQGQNVIVNLPLAQINLRAPKEMFGGDAHPGQRYQVRLSKVDPLTGELKLAEAWPDGPDGMEDETGLD